MNNNDKQLLIDAARAVGLKHDGICEDFFDPECTLAKGLLIGEFIPWVWNPIEDDGQAFRLMVDLDIELSISKEFHPVTIISGIGLMPFNKKIDVADGDRLAATRRAITTAAAELGRSRRDE